MSRRRAPRALALALAVLAGVWAGGAASAGAASLVVLHGGNVAIARPDGSGLRAITTDGSPSSPYVGPSEDDHGVIVAGRGSGFVRLDHAGRRLGTVPSVATGAPAGTAGSGPFSPRVSPDGRRIAYVMGYASGTFSPACNCVLQAPEEDVVYAWADGSGPAGTSRFWGSPAWADARNLVVAAPSNRQTEQLGLADADALGDGTATRGWFNDDGTNLGGYWVDLNEPDLARTLDRLVVVRGMQRERLALYAVGSDGAAALRCELTAPNGWYVRPSWSPDGRVLTYADRAGLWAVDVPDDWDRACALQPRLIVPGASEGGWTAADWTPAPPAAAPSGTPAPATSDPGAARAGIDRLALRGLPHRAGLRIDIEAHGLSGALAVEIARCGQACRRVATLRRPAAARTTVRWRRRLSPGRYLVTVRADGLVRTAERRIR